MSPRPHNDAWGRDVALGTKKRRDDPDDDLPFIPGTNFAMRKGTKGIDTPPCPHCGKTRTMRPEGKDNPWCRGCGNERKDLANV